MITPSADRSLRQLLEHLKAEMNEESQALVGLDAVIGLREFQTDLNTVQNFPLLMGYRSQYSGSHLQISTVIIEWFFLNAMEIERQPGWLNWGIRKQADLLSSYDLPDPCLRIDPAAITGEIRYGQVRDGVFIPFTRITIANVTDLD